MTTDTGMVEQCARAICGADGYDEDASWELYVPQARAVLECLRTPTPEMLEAMFDENASTEKQGRYFSQLMSDLFTAAIDRALSPSKGEGE